MKSLVSFEIAKWAKYLGFDEKCTDYYNSSGIVSRLRYFEGDGTGYTTNTLEDPIGICPTSYYTAPTLFQVQNWLTETHNCLIEIKFHSTIKNTSPYYPEYPIIKEKNHIRWCFEIVYFGDNFQHLDEEREESDLFENNFESYLDALRSALLKSLLLINGKQNYNRSNKQLI